jgi:hypothetical protein
MSAWWLGGTAFSADDLTQLVGRDRLERARLFVVACTSHREKVNCESADDQGVSCSSWRKSRLED